MFRARKEGDVVHISMGQSDKKKGKKDKKKEDVCIVVDSAKDKKKKKGKKGKEVISDMNENQLGNKGKRGKEGKRKHREEELFVEGEYEDEKYMCHEDHMAKKGHDGVIKSKKKRQEKKGKEVIIYMNENEPGKKGKKDKRGKGGKRRRKKEELFVDGEYEDEKYMCQGDHMTKKGHDVVIKIRSGEDKMDVDYGLVQGSSDVINISNQKEGRRKRVRSRILGDGGHHPGGVSCHIMDGRSPGKPIKGDSDKKGRTKKAPRSGDPDKKDRKKKGRRRGEGERGEGELR